MGKIKTVIMGDQQAEQKVREKERVKREAKKAEKKSSKAVKQLSSEPVISEAVNQSATDLPTTDSPINRPTDLPKQKTKSKKQEPRYNFLPGKKAIAAASLVDKSKTYSFSEALDLVKKTSFSKFDGSVELHLNVSDKGLRGSVSLPHGTGKQIRVAIATDELINQLTSQPINFDILVASPDMMPKLARVAKILGPKGLMPNPKTGTIGQSPEKLAEQLSQGQVQWKTQNDFPIIHAVIGKVSFDNKKLEENYQALIKSIGKDKIKSAFLKPTMGPSVKLQI